MRLNASKKSQFEKKVEKISKYDKIINMIGYKLKELRKINKKKQKDIAKYLNIAQNTYSQYENNIRTPDVETIKKICIFYDITADELLELDTEKKRQTFINSFNGNFKNTNIKF